MKYVTLSFVILVFAFCCAATGAAEESGLAVQFDKRGLTSLKFANQELLVRGNFDLRERSVITSETHLEAETPAAPRDSFDQSANRLEQEYDWGTISCVYRVDGERLFLDIDIKNTAKHAIRLLDLSLMRLQLPGWKKIHFPEDPDAAYAMKLAVPGWAKNGDWETRWPQPVNKADDPQVNEFDYDGGKLMLCGEEPDRPLGLHIVPDGDADQYALILRYEGPPLMQSLIGEGDSRHFRLSVRFGSKTTDSIALADDLYKKFADRYPRDVKWPDHRPIGSLNLSSSAMGLKKNPRGWWQDRTTTDVTTPQGIAAFHEKMLKHADICIGFAKDMNAQGIIVWDIEGQEMPHMISYIGDPRLMDQMAPEMSGVADAFMKKFTDAGLRIGVTIRPSHVIHTPGAKQPWEHVQADDPVEEISEKIAYAKKRWGCTLFYIDSTVLWLNEPSGALSLKIMPADFFRILHERFPDSLLIPEQSATRHWAYTAPYYELQHGYHSTPDSVRATYPDAFSVLRVVDSGLKLVQSQHDELVKAVRGGDILLYRTWFDDPYDLEVKKIYEDAGVGK